MQSQHSHRGLRDTKTYAHSGIIHRKRIFTQPSTTLLKEKNPTQAYDTSLFHKTIFHLQPIKNNPQLYGLVYSPTRFPQSLSKRTLFHQACQQNKINQDNKAEVPFLIRSIPLKNEDQTVTNERRLRQTVTNYKRQVIPHQASVLCSKKQKKQRVLNEQNLEHITAKKWIIYDMRVDAVIKGYKYKKPHDIASLSKLLCFYTAYAILSQYFIPIHNFQMATQVQDTLIKGSTIDLKAQDIVCLQGMLYALLLSSANNAATIIANNLGHYVLKKKKAEYFSCFDISAANRSKNVQIFLQLMQSHAQELGLKETRVTSPHGIANNMGSAHDVAKVMAACFKIPLFCKIITTKLYEITPKCISSNGECTTTNIPIQNTNKLLWRQSSCIGGKTGSNSTGGESFAGCYPAGIAVVVLDCGGKEEKFADAERLFNWVQNQSISVK